MQAYLFVSLDLSMKLSNFSFFSDFYTCDKQVLWESAGAFSPRQLVSRGKSHSSRVRGLVVKCLLFNQEISCSNRCVCGNFFTSIPKQEVSNFFGTIRLPLFGFVRLFWKIFQCPQRVPVELNNHFISHSTCFFN